MRQLGVCAAMVLAAGNSVPANAGLPDPPFSSSVWVTVPALPTTRSNVVVRNIWSGCNPASGARAVEIDHASGLIDFYLADSSDICDQYYYDDIKDTHIGYLQPGNYTVRFIGCTIPYDPEFAICSESAIPRLSFGVTDAGRPRRVIPAWSFAGAFATVFLLAGIALLRLKPRQG